MTSTLVLGHMTGSGEIEWNVGRIGWSSPSRMGLLFIPELASHLKASEKPSVRRHWWENGIIPTERDHLSPVRVFLLRSLEKEVESEK